jgi:phosphatidylserine/phosphatidylglycerophosphate/cardiolipin synthase-like enzyme
MASIIRAYANCDHSYVVWRYDEQIPECRGFALHRKHEATGADEVVETWVGFEGDEAPAGTFKPSTVWPIQKYAWSDYSLQAGDRVRYRVVPMVGPKDGLQPREELASEWTDVVAATPDADDGLSAYFNRGVVATQFVSRSLDPGQSPADRQRRLKEVIDTVDDPLRNFLSGELRVRMLKLLADAASGGSRVYAALYELNDPELIGGLTALGDRAAVVLANGATKDPQVGESEAAEAELIKAGVTVHRRYVDTRRHFDHHKYLVLCDGDDRPVAAWTGSTNWTETGLCTQSNNAVLIPDATVAGWFKDHWQALVDAGDDYPDSLVQGDADPRIADVGATRLTAWFAPVPGFVDLEDARKRIDAAKDGILFLFFNPGPSGSLLNFILERTDSTKPTYDPSLFIHGALNQDPSTSKHPLTLFHRGHRDDANFDVVLPEAIDRGFGFWVEELRKYQWAFAMVHSKVVVVDPFGEHPVVITGSHNMGPKASSANDDNLVIIEGNRALAAAYAVNIMTVYNQYRWRFIRWQKAHRAAGGGAGAAGGNGGSGDGNGTAAPAEDSTRPSDTTPEEAGVGSDRADPGKVKPAGWAGLYDNDTWQHEYLTGAAKKREIQFWLGLSAAGVPH